MNLLVLNSTEIKKLIHLDELRLMMQEALLTTSNAETISELRHVTKFNENNVSDKAKPGKINSHGYSSIVSTPLDINEPHELCGG